MKSPLPVAWGTIASTMLAAIDAFRDHLRSEKRSSAHTLRAYLHDVGELAVFARNLLGRDARPDEVDVIVCRSYLASLHGRNDAATIGRKLSSLRTFFRLLVRRRVVASNPVAALRPPKRAKRLPAFLGKEEVGRLLDGPGAGGRGRGRSGGFPVPAVDGRGRPIDPAIVEAERLRDDALFETIYGAGLRVSEACNLDLRDVQTGRGSGEVKVRQGKGRKDRLIPLGGKALAALERYFPRRAAWLSAVPTGDREAVFLTRRGRRMWGYPVLLLALSLAPLLSNRHRDLVAVAFVPVLAVLFGDRLSRVSGRWVAALCSGLAIVFLLVPEAGWLRYPSAWPWTLRLSRANCPEAAVAFLNKEDIGSRMFNAYDYGGFLVDQLHRKRLDFIDGRLLVGERVYEEYLDVRDGGDGAQSILDRYHIDLLVIRYPQPGGYQNLAREARDWPEWALVFWDDTTLIYARRDRVEGGWLAAHAYRWLDPTLPSPMRARAYWVDHYGDLIREAERAALDAPLAARPVLSLALAHEYNGHIDAAARDYRRVLEMHPENRPAREGLNRLNDARR